MAHSSPKPLHCRGFCTPASPIPQAIRHHRIRPQCRMNCLACESSFLSCRSVDRCSSRRLDVADREFVVLVGPSGWWEEHHLPELTSFADHVTRMLQRPFSVTFSPFHVTFSSPQPLHVAVRQDAHQTSYVAASVASKRNRNCLPSRDVFTARYIVRTTQCRRRLSKDGWFPALFPCSQKRRDCTGRAIGLAKCRQTRAFPARRLKMPAVRTGGFSAGNR
jgi:hypothetical protein